MGKINLYSDVRLLTPCDAYGEIQGEPVRHLPTGSVGRVIDVLARGKACIVDFTIREPVFGPGDEVLDYGESRLVTLAADQVEPAA